MKKVIFIMMFLMVSLTLKAVEPTIKFYLEDGNSKEYRIEDLIEMSFIKSDILYTMKVFLHDTSYSYLNTNISSIELTGVKKIKINLPVTLRYFNIAAIDSIIFISNDCSETTIGNQIWSCKNLDVDHYRNGDPIPQVTDSIEWSKLTTGAWCYYNNDPAMDGIYGKLYNWYAVTDPRGLAPVGWHIPSEQESNALEEFLGGMSEGGGKLKSIGTYQVGDGLWVTPNEGATNESGFSGLPAGNRNEKGEFWGFGIFGSWLNSSKYVLGLSATYDNAELFSIGPDKESGQSVRCIKGEIIVPVIKSITPNSGFVEDEVTITGTGFGINRSYSQIKFEWSSLKKSDYLSWSDTEIKVKVPYYATSGKVIVSVNEQNSNAVDFTVKQNVPGDCKYIPIGNQVWTCKNLDVDHYRNGDSIPQVTDSTEWDNLTTGAWCYFNNDAAYGTIYGKLYNWYAVNDPRGLAPIGWHIPNDGEWKTLERYLGMGKSQADSTGYRGTDQGLQLKVEGTEYWRSPNTGASDKRGFSALPSSYRGNLGAFFILGKDCYWWTSSADNSTNAQLRSLNYYYDGIYRNTTNKKYGFSVRCVQGEVSTLEITSLSPYKALIGREITIEGTGFGTFRNYSFVSLNSIILQPNDYLSWSDTKIVIRVPAGTISGKLFVNVNDLISNQVDYTIIQVQPESCEAVTIGTQVWMCKNLDVSTYRNGDTIPQVTDSLTWSKLTTGAWCYYNNDPAMGAIYGKLYNWFAVKDPRGLAPAGWHIPKDTEWAILTDYLGGSDNAGGKLKKTGIYEDVNGLWNSPNTGATNETGFSALPGGYRDKQSFKYVGSVGRWWYYTYFSYSLAWVRTLYNSSTKFDADKFYKEDGYSVRCIKD